MLYRLQERQRVEWDGRNFVSSEQVNYSYFRMKGRGLPYDTTPELCWKV